MLPNSLSPCCNFASWIAGDLGVAAICTRRRRTSRLEPAWSAVDCVLPCDADRALARPCRLGCAGLRAGVRRLLVWWQHIAPSNDRMWADDVARITSARSRATGSLCTMCAISIGVPTMTILSVGKPASMISRTHSVDMIMSYWTAGRLPHAGVFRLRGCRHVAFSVEVRALSRTRAIPKSAASSRVRAQHHPADERDVIRVRPNVRGEDDYLIGFACAAAYAFAFIGYRRSRRTGW